MAKNVKEGTKSQNEFFASERAWQPVLEPWEPNEDPEKELRQIAGKLGWSGRKPWPSVWYMANKTGLKSLYSYMYSATSKWVHFSPHILLRMGWGGKVGDLSNDTQWEYTTNNFLGYYHDFNRVYSLMMFLRFIRGPAKEISEPLSEQILVSLESCLSNELRWPEDITFEEMNVKGPANFTRILLRAAHEIEFEEADYHSRKESE